MIEAPRSALTLMGFWSRHKRSCRPLSSIIADARAGRLPGIEPLASGFGHRIVDEEQALDAMKRSA